MLRLGLGLGLVSGFHLSFGLGSATLSSCGSHPCQADSCRCWASMLSLSWAIAVIEVANCCLNKDAQGLRNARRNATKPASPES